MICKIKDKDVITQTYTLEFPNGRVAEYRHNVNRNIFVGRNSTGPGDELDIYYFKFISDLKIDLEIAESSVTIKGYVLVKLRGVDKVTDSAHRMVCWSWNGSFLTKLHVDHINGDKKDNRPENLQAVPAIVNTFRAFINYQHTGQAIKYKNYEKPIKRRIIKCYGEIWRHNLRVVFSPR